MTKNLLRQVLLRRPTPAGYREGVFWIDNSLAKQDKMVQDEEGYVWTIAAIYNTREFQDMEKQYNAWKRWAEVLGAH